MKKSALFKVSLREPVTNGNRLKKSGKWLKKIFFTPIYGIFFGQLPVVTGSQTEAWTQKTGAMGDDVQPEIHEIFVGKHAWSLKLWCSLKNVHIRVHISRESISGTHAHFYRRLISRQVIWPLNNWVAHTHTHTHTQGVLLWQCYSPQEEQISGKSNALFS